VRAGTPPNWLGCPSLFEKTWRGRENRMEKREAKEKWEIKAKGEQKKEKRKGKEKEKKSNWKGKK